MWLAVPHPILIQPDPHPMLTISRPECARCNKRAGGEACADSDSSCRPDAQSQTGKPTSATAALLHDLSGHGSSNSSSENRIDISSVVMEEIVETFSTRTVSHYADVKIGKAD
ncbi:hypothetical protein ElyMa_000688200 [Elysia marginata]|uniref:Uncharacterized protein n=1 Tax=Elysia marginata TaxID=1093978 RepID=A0AAV4GI04_9GAST|nr:hypothetical protein ElyMa_000688200 [Elysia marginata]